ncbi:MAG: hypothetical protein MUF71_18350 [Candidatus Kapabacteria bacterium]|nr:hypothetical protein [Candidatus Kapabacteria bacterium]
MLHKHSTSKKPREADTATPDTWLHFLNRLAVKYKRRRPDYLVSLRVFGAKTMRELRYSVAM